MYRRLIRLELISQQEWRIIASFQELLKPKEALSQSQIFATRVQNLNVIFSKENSENIKKFSNRWLKSNLNFILDGCNHRVLIFLPIFHEICFR